jgi:TolB-like protein
MKLKQICLSLLAAVALQAAPQPLTVAVFDFTSREASTKDLGPNLSALLTALLSAEGELIMLERAELEKALGEQELGLSGSVAPDSAAKVGNLTGAKVLVTGNLFKADKNVMVVAKVIGTETGRVYGTTGKMNAAGGDLSQLAKELAAEIASTIKSKAETLLAKVEPREDRIKRLVEKTKATEPLAVSVVIPEQHFGAPVIDPAAQTELLALLQKAGYEIVDAKSSKNADLEITGEAFSAFALRKGNLNACKARIELTARRREGGKILFTGSQTSVATDITEQTAAKTALENAALDIAERLLLSLKR